MESDTAPQATVTNRIGKSVPRFSFWNPVKAGRIHGRMSKDQSKDRSCDHTDKHKGGHIISWLHKEHIGNTAAGKYR